MFRSRGAVEIPDVIYFFWTRGSKDSLYDQDVVAFNALTRQSFDSQAARRAWPLIDHKGLDIRMVAFLVLTLAEGTVSQRFKSRDPILYWISGASV